MSSKAEEIRVFFEQQAKAVLAEITLECGDDILRQALIKNHKYIASRMGYQAVRPYSYLELCDIMEWKLTRVRR